MGILDAIKDSPYMGGIVLLVAVILLGVFVWWAWTVWSASRAPGAEGPVPRGRARRGLRRSSSAPLSREEFFRTRHPGGAGGSKFQRFSNAKETV